MTDEELIARLREAYEQRQSRRVAEEFAAADRIEELHNEWRFNANGWSDALARIEALTKERDDAEQRGYANAMEAERKLHEDRIEDLEAKLAKAVEALENLADCVDLGCFCSEMQMATAMDIARATLAEIKGESHE